MQNETSFQTTLDYIYSLKRFGIRLGLENISCLLSKLGNPHRDFPSVHVAGTNGKGSTAAFIYSIFKARGYRSGLFVSPHLLCIQERMQINQKFIPKEEFVCLFEKVRDSIDSDREITFFEFLTAMAFKYFSDQRVDLAVIEVGMGGRFDATNVISPEVSVITNIDYEHTEYLGKDLKDIAKEKGGIIKKDGILVTAIKEPEIFSLMEKKCSSQNARLFSLGRDFEARIDTQGPWETGFTFQDGKHLFKNLEIPLLGEYQVENAALAVKTALALKDLGWDIGEEDIREGLKRVFWRGRFDIVKREPTVICDGAHNPSGMKAFIESVVKLFSYDRLLIIFGVMNTKDFVTMGKHMFPHADRITLVRAGVENALDPETALEEFQKYGKEILVMKSLAQAIEYNLSTASEKDIVCITGSLYLISEALPLLESVSVKS